MQSFFRAIILLVILLSWQLPAQSRQTGIPDSLPVVAIDELELSMGLAKNSWLAFIGPEESAAEKYQQLTYQHLRSGNRIVKGEQVTTKALLIFRITNNSDSAKSAWFFPGLYYRDIQLYKIMGTGLEVIPSIKPESPREVGYRLLTVPSGDTITVLAELRFVRTYLNRLIPRLISASYLGSYVNDLANTNMQSKIVTYLFCGLLLMMLLFSLSSFLQGGNKEFFILCFIYACPRCYAIYKGYLQLPD